MTDAELQRRWGGALVKRCVTGACGVVDTARGAGGRIALTGTWADGSPMRCYASGVDMLTPQDVQRAFGGWAHARAKLDTALDEVATVRATLAALAEDLSR